MWPTPGETGRVEFIDFVGLEGRDYGPRALPPNLGILALRFPVADIAAAARDLAARGWPLTFPVTRTAIAPYGTVDILTVRTPDGAMIELFAPAR